MYFFIRWSDFNWYFFPQGMPTHDVKGEEVPKGQLKKLQKLYTLQEKKYNDYIASLKKEP